MKKTALILLILLIIPITVQAKTSTDDSLSALENSIFGFNYSKESDSVRIERIEKYLYGTKKSGSVQTRLNNIQNDIGYVEITKSEETNKQNDNLPPLLKDIGNNEVKNQQNSPVTTLEEDSTVEYPIVDEMEIQIFKTTYKNENIYQRLDRLEESIFQKKSNKNLNERVEKLKSYVVQSKMPAPVNTYSQDDLEEYYTKNGFENIDDQTMPFQLAVLEESIFKNSYDKDNISNRLNRLEQKLFKKTYSSDNDISRLQRIMVAYEAKKNSYKYENNKKMQNVALASQVGGILLLILAMLL